MRAHLQNFLANPWFDRTIMTLIVLNAITLAMETDASVMERFGQTLKWFDRAILSIFVIEIALRLIADFKGFWRDPWRLFDFVIVSVALLPATGSLSALRAFRILRVLRLVSSVPQMRRVVGGLLSALPGMGSIVLLLALVFFVFSVISTKLFAAAFPEWFGSLSASSYTLFQIMTLESWSMGIVRPVMEVFPHAWMLFVPFIIMTAFTVLNLFIGVIVDAMQSEHEATASAKRDAMLDDNEKILNEIKIIREEIAALRKAST
ncbi:MAG: ion transporter [Pseudoruegeria sp.]